MKWILLFSSNSFFEGNDLGLILQEEISFLEISLCKDTMTCEERN